ncbi:MAG TPA: LCP family protein [Nocardioidaceae bacterium]|nr:LCP family protein [Nocardioidaceae bacterium]
MTGDDRPAARSRLIGRRRRVFRAVAIGVAVVLAALAAAVLVVLHHLDGNISSVDLNKGLGTSRPSEIPRPNKPQQPMNILLIGSDTREGQRGHFGIVPGARSDTTILLHLNADRTLAYGVSIPRDSIVQRPPCKSADGSVDPGGRSMFNAAYSVGGPLCTVKTVSTITGVPIEHFVEIDFNGFRDMVNALGGVQVCLPYAVHDTVGHINLPAGTHTLNGYESLQYVRERYAFSGGGDVARTHRQQAFLASMASKALSAGTLANPIRLYRFMDAATRSLTTDTGLDSVTKLVGLARQLKGISKEHIQFVTVRTKPYAPNPDRLVWKPSAHKIWDAMIHDRPLPKSLRVGATTAAGQLEPGTGTAPGKHHTSKQETARARAARTDGLCASAPAAQ